MATTSTVQEQARALGDPTRYAIFRHLAHAGRPLGIAELNEPFAFNHNAIRQHVSKLVAAGLVIESKAASRGRGRPRLVYEVDPAADGQWAGTGPYERLSRLLLDIIRTGDGPEVVGRRAADQFRVSSPSGDAIGDVRAAMARQGFQPESRKGRGGGTEVVLHNCPFASAALADRETVCSLHLGIADGLVDGTDIRVEQLVANDPRKADCKIRLCPDGAAPPATTSRLSLRGKAGVR
jgi:predicted ArsR family transcriptional regulator